MVVSKWRSNFEVIEHRQISGDKFGIQTHQEEDNKSDNGEVINTMR